MPVVTFQRPDLCRLIGQEHSSDELGERMPMMGGDLDKIDGDAITIEWFPDRPDLLTLEGTGRALRAFLGNEPGMPTYDVAKATTELRVDPSVAKVRPYAALCFVRDVPMDDDYVQTIIDAQEKLTLAPGRKRRKIAIGIHDAAPGGERLEGPFTYTCVGPDDKPFVPLAWDDGTALTPAQIMEQHPKGQEYGHLLPDGLYPVFLDGKGDVLSLPPVINAAKTTVTAATRDLLLDVTGTDPASVRRTIALLATGFAERGGSIEAVTVHDASGTWSCPDLRPAERTLDVEPANTWLGIDLTADEMADCLRRMGHGAEAYDTRILVQTPAWRADILHDVDLMEDVAIGHGFENFQGCLPTAVTHGGPLAHQGLEDRLRLLLVGHGMHEARTLTLSNEADQWTAWGEAAPEDGAVRVRNPVLEEQTILRTRLVPSLLRVLAANRHRELPQRLFEMGYVVHEDAGEPGAWRNRLRLGVVETAGKAGFSDAKGLAEALLRDTGLDLRLAPGERPGLIPGRQGRFLTPEGTEVGWFGELHPDTIVHFGLSAATLALELDLAAVSAATAPAA
ncbi:MAG: phenylalanine--tRNA ligase subunit beta [Thermoplasmatota archaeon]